MSVTIVFLYPAVLVEGPGPRRRKWGERKNRGKTRTGAVQPRPVQRWDACPQEKKKSRGVKGTVGLGTNLAQKLKAWPGLKNRHLCKVFKMSLQGIPRPSGTAWQPRKGKGRPTPTRK